MTDKDALKDAIIELDEEAALDHAKFLVSEKVPAIEIIETSRLALSVVGEMYERREYYLGALIMGGEIFRGIMEILNKEKLFRPSRVNGIKRKVIMGVPLGDVHDIGKDIVITLLQCSGFDVIDLGVNVTPDEFVLAARNSKAAVMGMSVLLTVTYEPVKETVCALERAGLRDKVKIIVGGGAASQKLKEYAGVDAWSKDAMEAVALSRRFYMSVRS